MYLFRCPLRETHGFALTLCHLIYAAVWKLPTVYKVCATVSVTLVFNCLSSVITIFKVRATVKEHKGVDSRVVILNKTEAKKLTEIKSNKITVHQTSV